MEEKVVKTSKARIEANRRYEKKSYKRWSITFRNDEYEAIKNYCQTRGLTFNGFIRKAAMDIVNNSLKLDDF